jgi:ketosteroid isomerase-like protein
LCRARVLTVASRNTERAMSSQNVDVMRRIVEAAGRKDYQAVLVDLDPELEIDDTDIPESTGTDSFLEWLARWDQAWETWRLDDLEVRAAADDQAIALFTMVAKGKGSGIELTRPDALVASFRGGKAVKLGYYNDQALALEAVGLSA